MRLAELPVYVVHSPTLRDRRTRLEPQLLAQGVTPTWITEPDPPALTRELLRGWYRPSRARWWLHARVTGSARYRPLGAGEISAAIKHALVYERIAAGSDDWALVLEDDAVFAEDFAACFDRRFESLPEDADVVFIGACSGLRVHGAEPGRHFYRKSHPASRCADAYLLTRATARGLRERVAPLTLPIDWELSYWFKRLDARIYWLEPPLVAQGSETGIHDSTLRH